MPLRDRLARVRSDMLSADAAGNGENLAAWRAETDGLVIEIDKAFSASTVEPRRRKLERLAAEASTTIDEAA